MVVLIMKRFRKTKIMLSVLLVLAVVYTVIVFLPKGKSVDGVNPFIRLENERPILVAHAGGNLEFPANTLEAFYNAYSIDKDALLETDMNMTKDGVLILNHDTSLQRTTNLDDVNVIDITYQALVDEEVNFGYDDYDGEKKIYQNYAGIEVTPLDVSYPDGISPRHTSKFLVTTLEELITTFPDSYISVEIKQEGETGLQALTKTIELLDELDAEYQTYERVSLASFDKAVSDGLVKLRQTTHKQLLYSPQTNGVVTFYVLQLLRLDFFYNEPIAVLQIPMGQYGIDLATRSMLEVAHNHNIAIHYWNINEEADMRTLIKLGADGIMSDRPTLLKEILDEYYPA